MIARPQLKCGVRCLTVTEEQIPLYVLIAFLGGCFAGAWTIRSSVLGAILLTAAIMLDVTAWMTYGFIVNWEPSWGIQNIMAGILWAGFGMLIFATVPALVGFGLSVFVVKVCFRKPKRKIRPNAPNNT